MLRTCWDPNYCKEATCFDHLEGRNTYPPYNKWCVWRSFLSLIFKPLTHLDDFKLKQYSLHRQLKLKIQPKFGLYYRRHLHLRHTSRRVGPASVMPSSKKTSAEPCSHSCTTSSVCRSLLETPSGQKLLERKKNKKSSLCATSRLYTGCSQFSNLNCSRNALVRETACGRDSPCNRRDPICQ